MAEFSTYELVILFSAFITLLYVAYRFMYLLYDSVKEKVKNTSKRYNDILSINASYNFYNNIKQEYPSTQRLKTNQQFDRFNFDRFFQEDIEKSKAFFDSLISKVNKNKALLDEYNVDISKGGKTIHKNLRTSCNSCNIGKSNKYDKDGIN